MSYPSRFQILYMGRKVSIFEQLQTIFAEQNQRVNQHSVGTNNRAGTNSHAGMHNGILSKDGHSDQSEMFWPLVELAMATNQKTALHLIRAEPPALVLVELDQKSTSRLRFCDVVRYRLPTAPILAVAKVVPENSFNFDAVLALPLVSTQVVRTIQRFSTKHTEYLLQLGPISLNMATRTVVTPNGRYTMTPKQCALLKLLMNEHGEVVERRKIMESVWETNYLEDTRTLDVHIRWLRERIEQNPSKPVYLQTVRGVGYRFEIKNL